jgi:BED zinc finger
VTLTCCKSDVKPSTLLIVFIQTKMASLSKSASTSTSSETEKLENSRSLVWQYFERDKATQIATCSLCKAKLKSVGGSTGSLHVHLHSKHKITLLKRKITGDDHDASCGSVEPLAPTACDGSNSASKRQDKDNITKYFGTGRKKK